MNPTFQYVPYLTPVLQVDTRLERLFTFVSHVSPLISYLVSESLSYESCISGVLYGFQDYHTDKDTQGQWGHKDRHLKTLDRTHPKTRNFVFLETGSDSVSHISFDELVLYESRASNLDPRVR